MKCCGSKAELIRVLHDELSFGERFITHLLTRESRAEEDLADHLFNSSEKRLARTLLLLANFGKEGGPQPIMIKISQETLAEIVGTTRFRVSQFMTNSGSWVSSTTTVTWRSIPRC